MLKRVLFSMIIVLLGVLSTPVLVSAESSSLKDGYSGVTPLTISARSLEQPQVGFPYRLIFGVGGVTDSLTWDITGLPLGLSYNASTGVVEGLPVTAGIYMLEVSASTVYTSATTMYELVIQDNDILVKLDVSPDKEWLITFNREVDRSTLWNNVAIWGFSDTDFYVPISIYPTVDKNTPNVVKVHHYAPFTSGGVYKCVIRTGIKDIQGNSLTKETIFLFTVK